MTIFPLTNNETLISVSMEYLIYNILSNIIFKYNILSTPWCEIVKVFLLYIYKLIP